MATATAPQREAVTPSRNLVEMSWDPITRIVGSLGIFTKIDFANRQVAECHSTSSIALPTPSSTKCTSSTRTGRRSRTGSGGRLAASTPSRTAGRAAFGIRGLDLAYALLDGYEAVILVDAAPRGGPPGTLYVLEPETSVPPEPEKGGPLIDVHGMDPVKVLRLVASPGGRVERLLVVGCEPAVVEPAEGEWPSMSDPVSGGGERGRAPRRSAHRPHPQRSGQSN